MATFYEDMQALASELLDVGDDVFGQSSATYQIRILTRSDQAGATDLDEPTVTKTPAQINAVVRGVNEKRDGAKLFAMAEKMVVIEAAGNTAPTLKDLIEVNGTEFAIVSVETLPHGDVPAVFKIAVKR